MPSIIPDPGSPPGVAPITSPLEGVVFIDADTQLYATTIDRIISGIWNSDVTNNGIVWLDNRDISNIHAWFAPGSQTRIWNNGQIYIHGAFQTELSPEGNYLVNTGSIYAISDSGWGRAIGWAAGNVYVENSGIIAAQGLGIDTIDTNWAGNATTIHSDGGLEVINNADGQILAEAADLAIAIETTGGDMPSNNYRPIVTNAGLIEANATGPDGTSIGIYVWNALIPATIVNSGTIHADFAIYGSGDAAQPIEHVQNLAGGVIEGLVYLDQGDDTFINDGAVVGDVDMGPGSDEYSASGTVSGVVDMGFDADNYSGSEGDDRATGGRGDDFVSGNGGQDLLFGGFGNDTLRGGAGNDGLIGEWGNDLIETLGGDYVEGGEDNDRIVLGDYTFEAVHGNSGTDTLVCAAGARNFGLAQMVAGGRVDGFEIVELQSGQQLAIDAASIAAITGGTQTLRIDAVASNTIHLDGSWTRGADTTIGGTLYEVWTQGGATVIVTETATVTPLSTPSFGGLDPVASGNLAPLPGPASGLDYTDPAVFLSQFTIFSGDFTVESREVFYSDGAPVFYSGSSDWSFTNNGEIYSLDDAFPSAVGLEFHGRTAVVNNGLIHVEELAPSGSVVYYPSLGVWMNLVPDVVTLENNGEISVYSVPNSAIGVSGAGLFRNTGLVSAISENSRAIGVNAVYGSHLVDNSQTFFNTGIIYAEAGGLGGQSYIRGDYTLPATYAAAGVAAYGTLTNDGDIIAVLGANADPDLDTVGVYLLKNYGNTAPNGVTNNGTIEGTIAIKFDNVPGEFSQIGHWVTNKGQIVGDIEFQDGDDQYNGSSGVIHGTVFGFGGDDSFVGGKLTDSFNGGAGNDTLTGNGGNDLLEGGEGNDLIEGGAGYDIASYSEALGGVQVNLGLTGAQNTVSAGNDTLAGIEDLLGSEFSDRFTGNSGSNMLLGAGGDDFLFGAGGNDILDGGDGGDIFFIASASEHTVAEIDDTGVAGTDEVRFSATGTAQTLLLRAGDTGIERVVIGTGTGASAVVTGLTANNVDARAVLNGLEMIGNSGANTLYATAFADTLTGGNGIDRLYGYGGNDLLDGGREADVMYGGAGDDTYVVDHLSDAPIELAGEGTDTVLASVAHTLKAYVEDLTLTGAYSITGRGNDLANVMTGNAGSNRLWGEAGNDSLIGNGGNDQLDGGSGDDSLIGGTGNDIYFVGSAGDTVTELSGQGIDRVETMIDYTLGANIENLTLAGSGGIDGIGNELANTLKGNGASNILLGLGGNDKLYGGGGNDTVSGGSSADWLEGGAGTDDLTGGTGSDRFVFRNGDFGGNTTGTADIIHDFTRSDGDKIRLDLVDANTNLAGTQDFAFIGAGAFTGVAGQLRYDQIAGNTYVSGDTNGDGIADFMIKLDGLHTLVGGDFIL